jgi:pimeloyl-ACP methyl ester carboxylesterase
MTDTDTQPSDQPAVAAAAVKPKRRRWRKFALRAAITVAVILIAATAASFGYNLATDGPAPRPAGLSFAHGGGFDTRYREWGTSGTPVVLIPGAFETADTFYALGPVLAAAHHRVFAIDLLGTGYSTDSGYGAPAAPFSPGHMADQLVAFEQAEGLTGPNAPILLGHSAGAAVVGLTAARGREYARGVVFLDGDATPIGGGNANGGDNANGGGRLLGSLLINPFRTSLVRLALSQDWLIRSIYDSMCGPACPRLNAAGVDTWRMPLRQPGFQSYLLYAAAHGIPAMTPGQFGALRAVPVPKLVIFGVQDPQMSAADARQTARRIGAPPPEFVPGRHLTMIASPRQITADLGPFIASLPRR